MTIASAIDDVIIAQGGTPDPTDTIADSLVNLAGVLAGENYPKDKTIEDAVTLLGEHIGGGGGTEYAITCTKNAEPVASYVYKAIWDAGTSTYIKDPDSPALDKAAVGEPLFVELDEGYGAEVKDEHDYSFIFFGLDFQMFYMPACDVDIYMTEE